MAHTTKVLGKSLVEGGGWTSGGVAKNSKIQLWGVIDITTYTAAGPGERITAAELGLATIDYINFSVVTTDTNLPAEASPPLAYFDYTNFDIYVSESVDTANEADSAAVLRFFATGDSVSPELT